ncbi:hypothetical protein FOVG_10122 [Fusarium oxysporum f. sp. pisi HDV247]|uniref:Uncharacterized protein n=1 Tax=Fusarium oxysporum f. sp. pisi HDV247 TaxID=1080344 RepID=W9PPH8_FUSOX|nr:hypothetical protein FOVG_10122 [Fusarium oxysporum f. sp. pisi HDV247]
MALRTTVAAFISLAIASPLSFGPSAETAAQRGPQIFNSVHDSLRKWGSTVHPNGMSLYLATIPEGVLLHHGNGRNETPTSLDWLAYEIEHAEMFARPGRPGPPGPPGPPGGREELRKRECDQVQLVNPSTEPTESTHGWLHTFQTTRPLQFLYIDGMSGDKGNTGVIDSQDCLLRGVREHRNGSQVEEKLETKPPGPPGEFKRAQDLCDLCAEWRLEGVIRAEGAGFEVIKCDFSSGMEQVQSLQRADSQRGPPQDYGPGDGGHRGPPRGPREGPHPPPNYRDIGPGRTILDYSSMVSAFFFPVNLTNPDSNYADLPRLTGTTEDEMLAIREYLATVLDARIASPLEPFTWRDVSDLIVHRYGDEISSIANSSDSTETVASRIRFLVEVFVDYATSDKDVRISQAHKRCSTFYIQTMPLNTDADKLIYAGFEAINAEICTALFKARELLGENGTDADSATLEEIRDTMKALKMFLSWSDYVGKEDDRFP